MSTVLVVDDEPDLRLLARLLLEMEGHDVAEAHDGEAAVAMLTQEHGIEVVLLDLRLPGISGWDVLTRLRDADALDGLRVVVFSAHMEPREHARALEGGARAYLTKPFTSDDLRAALAAATG